LGHDRSFERENMILNSGVGVRTVGERQGVEYDCEKEGGALKSRRRS